jgi:hypothetical protein
MCSPPFLFGIALMRGFQRTTQGNEEDEEGGTQRCFLVLLLSSSYTCESEIAKWDGVDLFVIGEWQHVLFMIYLMFAPLQWPPSIGLLVSVCLASL